MATTLRLLVPQETTNYIENPSVEYDLTGWTASDSTISRSLEEARFGISSIKVITNGSVSNEGVYYRVNKLSGISDFVVGSAYVRGTGTIRLRLIDNPTGPQWVSDKLELLSDRWQRISVLGRASGSDDFRLYIESDKDIPASITFYVDGAQLERQEEPTTYCDGDQNGCRWHILEHGSLSSRSAYTRAGGRWIDLAGPSCEEKNLYMTVVGGLGMAPIINNIQRYADAPGAYFQDIKIETRLITLTFHAKNPMGPRTNILPSMEPLHKLRQQLIDVLKPDRTAGAEPFTIEYQDGDIPLYLNVRYDGGLSGEWDVRNQFINSFPLRLLAVSPLMSEDDQEVYALNFRSTETINYIAQRFDGEWSEMNGGFNAQVLSLEIGTRGEIIAVGEFVKANNDPEAIDPEIFANHIAYWDGTQWRGYGSGASHVIRDISIAPNGYIYVTGDFTSIGGVAANRVAYWDGSAWSAMGTGLDDVGRAIEVAPNGDVYVGGDFTSAGGNPAYYVARWDGGTWHFLGAEGGVNNSVYAISITDDGESIYVGGAFTGEAGYPASPTAIELAYIAIYEPTFNSFSVLGTGFDAAVRVLELLPSGILYAGGDFTQSGDTELIFLYIAYWNGASWFSLGIGANASVRALALSRTDNIVVGGNFSRIGATDALYAALWNNSSYVNLDVEIGAPVYAAAIDRQENIFLAPNGTQADYAALTTINNIGSAEASPVLSVFGPCTLRWIENQTTQKRFYADLDIAENEQITIDFSQGTLTSNVRGNLAYAIEPGSDIRAWTLIPGENKIAVLMTDDVDAKIYLSYIPRHWGADATATPEDL